LAIAKKYKIPFELYIQKIFFLLVVLIKLSIQYKTPLNSGVLYCDVGLPGIAPGPPPPRDGILLLYYSPVSRLGLERYLFLPRDLMHLAQAEMRWPANGRNFLLLISWGFLGTLNHCRLGYFRTLGAGLYLPLNLLYLPKSKEPF